MIRTVLFAPFLETCFSTQRVSITFGAPECQVGLLGVFTVRGSITTLCQSRCEPGGAKVQSRKVSPSFMVLGMALAFFPDVRSRNLVCGPLRGTGPLPSLRRARASV